jgi:hypothetical protein
MAAELRKGQPPLSRARLDKGSYGGPMKERPAVTESACIQDTDFYKKHVNQDSTELKLDLSLLSFPVTSFMHNVITSIVQLLFIMAR